MVSQPDRKCHFPSSNNVIVAKLTLSTNFIYPKSIIIVYVYNARRYSKKLSYHLNTQCKYKQSVPLFEQFLRKID